MIYDIICGYMWIYPISSLRNPDSIRPPEAAAQPASIALRGRCQPIVDGSVDVKRSGSEWKIPKIFLGFGYVCYEAMLIIKS